MRGAGQVESIVRDILAQVRSHGDEAVIELTERIDKVQLDAAHLRVSAEEIRTAHEQADAAYLRVIRAAIANVKAYQQHIKVQAPTMLRRGGRELGVRYTPINRVGVYVPGGKAFYPSSMIMTIVPALTAGVKEIALASPPSFKGSINPMMLAIAAELGVTEVYRIGGAIAVAALAYGTKSIKPVEKIVGPGNAFVAQAKRQVLGKVGIDSIAGPSEVLIIADRTARADWVAADMLAQAEHDPGSAILVTDSRELAEAVVGEIQTQLPQLERAAAIGAALERYSAIVVVPDLAIACDVANEFATEHLQIQTANDEAMLAKIRNAGAIFLGGQTPVPLGDYYAGPSHVLPTGGTARFFSPLSVNDFMKASSVLRYDHASLLADAPDVAEFARREGLTGHANAIEKRRS